MTTTMTKTTTLNTIVKQIRIVFLFSPGEGDEISGEGDVVEHWHFSGILMDILVLAVLNRTLSVRLPFTSIERK